MPPVVHALLALVCAGLTWGVRRYALARRLVDAPGARRSHQVATPRGGGLAIVVVALGLLLWAALASPWPQPRPYWLCAAAGLALVAGVGWWDDHRPLSARLRLGVHLAAAVLLAWGARRAGLDWLPVAGLLLASVVLVNVWNFMDGIDGLAASQAAIVAATAAVLAADPGTRDLGFALAAACLGFLPFNLPRARIFLGDVGSGGLGYLLAVLAGALALGDSGAHARDVVATLMLLLLPAGAFLVDATLTLGRRMLRGERWWEPHVQHAYQAAARRWTHGPVTLGYVVWSCTGGVIAVLLHGSAVPFGFIMTVIVLWQAAGGLLWSRLQDADRGHMRQGSPS